MVDRDHLSVAERKVTPPSWPEESVARLYRAAVNWIEDDTRYDLFRKVSTRKQMQRLLQSNDLPTLPPRMKAAVRRANGWLLGRCVGEVLNHDVKRHADASESPVGTTLEMLHDEVAQLDALYADGCGRLWLVWLLDTHHRPSDLLLVEALLRSDSPFGLELVRRESSPWSRLDEAWTSPSTKLGPEHPCWQLTGDEVRRTLDGEREDPDLYLWLTGRTPPETRTDDPLADTPQDTPTTVEAGERTETTVPTPRPATAFEGLAQLHTDASAAALRLAESLGAQLLGDDADYRALRVLHAQIERLQEEHGPLGPDLMTASEVLAPPPDPTQELLDRLAGVTSKRISPEQIEALRLAASNAPEDGETRDALVQLAMLADDHDAPDVATLVTLSSRLPNELHPAVFALAQSGLVLPSTSQAAASSASDASDDGSHTVVSHEAISTTGLEDAAATAEGIPDDLDSVTIERDAPEGDDVTQAGSKPAPTNVEPSDSVGTTPDPASKDEHPATTGQTQRSPESVADLDEDLTPASVDASQASDVGDIVAELLTEHEFGAAAWVARAGNWSPRSIAIIEGAGYADVMRSASSSHARQYGMLAHGFSLPEVSQHRSLQLLALSAAARSTLVASYVGGIHVLETLVPTIDDAATRRIIESLTTVATSGIELSSQLLAGVRDRAELESVITDTGDTARRLLDELPQRKNTYHRATRVWQQWVQPGGLLQMLLRAVTEDDRRALPTVQASLVELRDERELSDRIDESDEYLTDPQTVRRNPIEASARTWLLRSAPQVLDVAEIWQEAASELEASDEGQRSRTAKKLERLREIVSADQNQALKWIEAAPEGRSRFAAGARAAAGDLLRVSFDLLLDGTPLPRSEPPVDAVRTLPLLSALDVTLSGGQPIDPTSVSGDAIVRARSVDLRTAFQGRSDEGDHETSELILDVLAWQDSSTDLTELRAAREDAIEGDLDAQRRLHERCSSRLRSSRQLGHVDEQQAAALHRTLEQFEPTAHATNTARLKAGMLAFEAQLDEHRRAAADQLSAKLSTLVERLPGKAVTEEIAHIRALIQAGNLDTAVELMSLVAEGRSLPVEVAAEGHLERFFPKTVDSFSSNQPPIRSLLDAVKERSQLGDLDFTALSAEAADRADRGLRAWHQLSDTSPTENRERLVDVLALLGLQVTESGVTHTTGLRSDARRQWFDLDDARPFSGATVHQFGTSARGRYRVMLTASRPSAPRLLELAADHTATRPLLILHVGVLDGNARRELAQQLRRDGVRRELIVIDDVIVAFLAAEGSGRFAATLSCCLPFSGVSPYTPYGLGNVPQEMFFGRDRELQSIQDRFGTLFIYGGRQLGKSALLRAAERDFQARSPHHVSSYVDLKARGIGVYRPADEIVDVIVDMLTKAGLPLTMPKNRSEWPEALVTQTQTWVSDHPERAVLLLLDEADEFLDVDAPQFRNVTLLKRIFETTGRAVKPVFAGLHQVQRFMSVPNQPLAHLGEHLEIGPLSPQAAFDLVTVPMRALGYRFDSPDTATLVLSHTNYQPGIIQLFADKLVQYLTRRPVHAGTPPYPINDDDIAAVHQDPDLSQEIRKRFDLTIALDSRYRIIAYTLALSATGGHFDHGLTPETLLQEASGWWPDGFQNQTVGSFTTLLDEMVGLGVLSRGVRDDQRVYGMRSPNTLRLLGSSADIENQLLEAPTLELEKPFDITVFHRGIEHDGKRRSSPLDEQQLSRLTERSTRFHTVLGSEAAGIDAITEVIRDAFKGGGPTAYVRTAPKGDFGARLKQSLSAGEDPAAHRVLIADLGTDRTGSMIDYLDRMRDAVERHAKPNGHRGTLSVIARVTSDSLESWHEVLNHPETTISSSVVQLARWSDHALRVWAEHIERPLDDAGIAEVRRSTGGWVTLIDEVEREWRRGVGWDDALARVRDRTNQRDAAEAFLAQLGLTRPSRTAQVFEELVTFGSGLDLDETLQHLRTSLEPSDGASAHEILQVLRALQVVELRADPSSNVLHLDPITERSWELVHG